MLTNLATGNGISKNISVRSVASQRPIDQYSFIGSIEQMGAVMSFARNSEIFGEGEPADYLYRSSADPSGRTPF